MTLPDTSLTSVLYAVLASACFGGALNVIRNGLQYMDPATGGLVNISVTTAMYYLLAPFALPEVDWRSPGILMFAAVGAFHPLLSTMLAFEAIRRMGATVSAAITSSTPLFAVVGAMIFLGERATLPLAVGTLGIVAGVTVLTWSGKVQPRDWALWALVFPLGASAIRGLTQMVVKPGLALVPVPLAAAMVSYTVSALGASIIVFSARRHRSHRFHPRGVPWLFLGGVLNGTAILGLYQALTDGLVVVISPIVATFPVFALFFSLVIFRNERITRRIVVGVALVVGSAMLIGVNL